MKKIIKKKSSKKTPDHPLLHKRAYIYLNAGDQLEGIIEEVTEDQTVVLSHDNHQRSYVQVIPAYNIAYLREALPKLVKAPAEPQ